MKGECMACVVFRLCDGAPELLRDVCLERGWHEFDEEAVDPDATWSLWWKSSGFRTGEYEDCRPWQRLNHFPKTSAITRKDCLARNLRRMRGVYGNYLFNFAPLSFNLPNDYRKFVAEYSKKKDATKNIWICKPADLSRGRGIFLFENLLDLTYDSAAVVQRYISSPLLICGYKFDLRLYVLVTSFHPLCIYVYHEGMVRFSTEKFDLSTLSNLFSHLTNSSINKQGPSYSLDKERIGTGCKWTLSQLRAYFHQHNIGDGMLWHRINTIIILTLLTQAPEVSKSCTNCFELYGFDILIDENLKPWLLEVNFSPSLGSDCLVDLTIKKPLLNDTFELLNFNQDLCIPKATLKSSHLSKSNVRPKSQLLSSKNHSLRSALKPLQIPKSKAIFQFKSQPEESDMEQSTASSCTEDMDPVPKINQELKSRSHSSLSITSTLPSDEFVQAVNTAPSEEGPLEYTAQHKPETSVQISNPTEPSSQSEDHQRSKKIVSRTSTKLKPAAPKGFPSARRNTISGQPRNTSLPPLRQPSRQSLTEPFPRSVSSLSKRHSTSKSDLSIIYKSKSLTKIHSASHRKKPQPKPLYAAKVGNFFLVFPFNDATQKAVMTGPINTRAVVEEVKKMMQLVSNRSATQSNIEESLKPKDTPDLSKPFWGFRPVIEYTNNF